jgi:hypothetical protein
MKKAALVISLFAAIGFVSLVSADSASAFFFGGKGLFGGGKASYGCGTNYGCYYPAYVCPPAGCKVVRRKAKLHQRLKKRPNRKKQKRSNIVFQLVG